MTLALVRAIFSSVDSSSAALRSPPSRAGAARPSSPGGLPGARAVLEGGHYWTVYEPLLEVRSLRVTGHEALARFERPDGGPINTASMFGLLHADPALLVEAELALKRHQLAHAPGGELFVNLDPDSWSSGVGGESEVLSLLSGAGRRLVVEVIENTDGADAVLGRDLVATLRARDLRVALDDVGATNGLLSFETLDTAEVLKFDRSLLRRLGSGGRRRAIVEAFVRMARDTGARTVLEGVETLADLALARDLGVDLVQGYLFKDQAIVARR
jgi:EAL domain-containing protein (putative c-di-GMP-specific phosphodiesterase class I)